jgi:predicted Ser/Thr protein kinase
MTIQSPATIHTAKAAEISTAAESSVIDEITETTKTSPVKESPLRCIKKIESSLGGYLAWLRHLDVKAERSNVLVECVII